MTTTINLSLKHLKALIKLVDAKQVKNVRYYLYGVNVKTENGLLKLAATDGHTCGYFQFNAPGQPDFNFILPYEFIKDIRKVKGYNNLVVTLDTESPVEVSIKYAEGYYNIKTVDGRYPDYEVLYRPEFEESGLAGHAMFNFSLFKRFADLAKELDLEPRFNMAGVKKDSENAVLVQFLAELNSRKTAIQSPEQVEVMAGFRGLLMPIRSSGCQII